MGWQGWFLLEAQRKIHFLAFSSFWKLPTFFGLRLLIPLLLFFFFFFLFFATPWLMKLPGKGSDPSIRCDLHCSYGNARSFKPTVLPGTSDSIAPQREFHLLLSLLQLFRFYSFPLFYTRFLVLHGSIQIIQENLIQKVLNITSLHHQLQSWCVR